MTVEEWLIDAVRVRPIIWNTKDGNYKNTKLKNEAYDEIAKEYEMSVSEIKKKWHSIRSAFSRELRMRNLYSNMGPNLKREWKHFNKLMFLQDECELDLNEEMESEYAIQFVSEDETPSTLYHLSGDQSSNAGMLNGQCSTHPSSGHNISPHKQSKKRKVNYANAAHLKQQSAGLNSFMQNHLRSPSKLTEEEIFGHSIAASLRKFDEKKKEIVKLKLQEVIVQYLNE